MAPAGCRRRHYLPGRGLNPVNPLTHDAVVDHRDHDQRQHGRDEQTEQQRHGQAREDRVVEDEQRASHSGDRGQRDGFGAHHGGVDHRLLERAALAHLLVDEVH